MEADFAFGIYRTNDLKEPDRHFSLSAKDIALLNPNTRTCPTFRSKRDMLITKAIYDRVPILLKTGSIEENPWNIKYRQGHFNMTSDSHLFRTYEQLEAEGWRLKGNIFYREKEKYLPLYEGKMIWHFDHRFGTYEGQTQAQANQGKLPELTEQQHADPSLLPIPQYWVHESNMPNFTEDGIKAFLAFRDVTNATVLRTAIFSIIPVVSCNHKLPIIRSMSNNTLEMIYLSSCMSSFIFDYITRQKMGGTSLGFFILKQLPILPPKDYAAPCHIKSG